MAQEKITQDSVLICNGIPVGVPLAAKPKLTKFLKMNVLTKAQAQLSDHPNNVEIYFDEETQKTTGIAFIDFKNDKAALTFKATHKQLKFDNSNFLTFYTKKEIDEFLKEEDEYKPLTFNPIETYDFTLWLRDEKYLEGNEYVTTFTCDKSINIGWYNPNISNELNLLEERPFKSKNCFFSPSGTFLYNISERGVIVYQPELGKNFHFPHTGLTHVTISSKDNFIATYSPNDPHNHHIIVWDIRFKKGMKFFSMQKDTKEATIKSIKKDKRYMPTGNDVVQFSNDEQYIARICDFDRKKMEVYTTRNFQFLGNQAVSFDSEIDKFSWNPVKNILCAYHQPSQKNNEQAHFYFYDCDKQQLIYTHKVFSLKEADFYWHPSGNKLVVKAAKTKKASLLVFSFDKDITVTHTEINGNPIYLEVNPVKNQFGMLFLPNSKKGENILDPTFNLYDISSKETKLMTQIFNIEIKTFSYSPNGQFLILNGIGKADSYLYFYNTDKMKLFKRVEVQNMSYIEWDPMGLYLAVVRSYLHSPHAKNGVMIYDCFGNLQYENYKQGFAGLLWRPQPNNQMTDEMRKEIDNKFKETVKTMKEEIERKKELAEKEKKEKQEQLMKRFREIVRKNVDLAKKERIRCYDETITIKVEEIRKNNKKGEEEEEEEIVENVNEETPKEEEKIEQ